MAVLAVTVVAVTKAGQAGLFKADKTGLEDFSQPKRLMGWSVQDLVLLVSSKPRISAPIRERESCLLYTSPSPRDDNRSRMPSSA